MSSSNIFEAEITDIRHYRLSYGGQSEYFFGLQRGKLLASKCSGCGFTWAPLRPVCSKCHKSATTVELSGRGEILVGLMLPEVPHHLQHLNARVATALVRPDGADTCIKAFVVTESAIVGKGMRVEAKYLSKVNSIADFYFSPLDGA